MKAILFPAAGLALLWVAPAYAACSSTIGLNSNTETIAFGGSLDVPVPGSATCSVVSTIVVPDGYYGVFKADSRGTALLDTGDTATNSLVGTGPLSGQSSGKGIAGIADEPMDFSGYYAVGLASGDTPFSADASVVTTGSSAGTQSTYDSLELLVGYTTLASQQDSLGEIGIQQLGLATHLDATAGLLTGANQPLEGDNEIELLGGVGSYTFGVAGRYNLAEGFSLLGGASIVNLAMPGAGASGVLAAGALRFVQPGADEFRYFGEAGVQVAALGLNFSRHYDNGKTANYAATASGDGLLGGAYVRGGALWAPNADNDVVFSATLKQGALGIGGMVEDDPNGSPNFFSANYSHTGLSFTTIKGGVDWTTRLAAQWTLAASLGVGTAFANGGASANVFGVGTVTGAAPSTLFAEYGLRLGWTPTAHSRIDGFVAGSAGTGIGAHTQIGAAYHLNF